MDPFSGAMTFATIVGLLSSFKSERNSNELREFIDWLKQKDLENVASNILANKALENSLAKILATNHHELCERLGALNEIIAGVASKISVFSDLASFTNPETVLSGQAVEILRQLVDSDAKEFIEIKVMTGGPDVYRFIGAPGDIQYGEPRFMDDDLNTLVELGLLRLEFGSRGSRRFLVTRRAVQLLSELGP